MSIKRSHLFFAGLTIAALLLSACSRSDKTSADDEVESLTPASVDFLLFPNPNANLGVGDYSIVISNLGPTVTPTTYTLVVSQTNGANQTFTGTWTMGDTISQPIQVRRAGGMNISLNSGSNLATLALRVAGATSDIVATNPVGILNPTITLVANATDQAAYAQAYYAAIDPTNTRTTLADFKQTNGFGATCVTDSDNTDGFTEYEVRFRDVEDLGYGRHLCVRRDDSTGQVAAWVENFQVTAIPGQNYGPLNLAAVVQDDRRWHVGTNAIEFTPTPFSGSENVVKFYTFNPDGTRRTLVDLDGRGGKAMPVPCISCHGGTALPLTAAGLFPTVGQFTRGDTRAHMQPLDVGSLDFHTGAPFRRSDQEASLKAINQIVLCTYPLPSASAAPEDACRTATTGDADWPGTTAEMIKTWYEDVPNLVDPSLNSGMESATFNDVYVPSGWTDAGSGVAGSQALYQDVVAPYCRVCHALRGTDNPSAGLLNSRPGSDINFMSYATFVGATGAGAPGFVDRIKHHVYDKGNMPLAWLKAEQFWASTAPSNLSPHVPGSANGGGVLRPNRPVAIPGPDRTIVTGLAHKLTGAESINAASYSWRISSLNAAQATLTNANTSRPTFTANVSDTYTLELVVSNGAVNSDPATLTIGAVATLADGSGALVITDPTAIRFSDIREILQDTGTGGIYGCLAGCHTNTVDGPPVFYNNFDRDGSTVVDADDLHQFYLDVRARVNFTDVASSKLLQRPSGHHHPGGERPNFDATAAPGAAGRGAYDIFLNWILNGAPE